MTAIAATDRLPARLAEPPAPYPGLRPFREDESLIFFGRDDLTEELVERLQGRRFVALVGESGTGKSSLVYAGLLPALKAGYIVEAGRDWTEIILRPGQDPVRALAEKLIDCPDAYAVLGLSSIEQSEDDEDGSSVSPDDKRNREIETIANRIGGNPFALLEILRQTRLQSGKPVLLLVDQFEEIFRYRQRPDPAGPQKLVANLLQILRAGEAGIYSLITMRSDYLGECARFAGLAEVLNESQYLVPRLTRAQQEEAIVGPLERFGAAIQPQLCSALLNAKVKSGRERLDPAEEGKDKVPLLQHALLQIWTTTLSSSDHQIGPGRGKILLTLETAKSLAGEGAGLESEGLLQGILEVHLAELMTEVRKMPGAMEVAERLFRSLTNRDRKRDDSRREVTPEKVAGILGVSAEKVIAVADLFRADESNFLLPDMMSEPQLDKASAVDLVHESLIRRWSLLRGWAESERKDITEYRRLVRDAKRWKGIDAPTLPTVAASEAPAKQNDDKDYIQAGLLKSYREWPEESEKDRKLAWLDLYYGEGYSGDAETEGDVAWKEDYQLVLQYIAASAAHVEKEDQARRNRVLLPALAFLFVLTVAVAGVLSWNLYRNKQELKSIQEKGIVATHEAASANRERDAARGERDRAQQQTSTAQNSLAILRRQLADKQTYLVSLRKRLAKETIDLAKAEKSVKEQERRFRSLQRLAARQQQTLNQVIQQANRADDQLKEANSKSKAAFDSLADVQQQLKASREQLTTAKNDLARAQDQVTRDNALITAVQGQLALAHEAEKQVAAVRSALADSLSALAADDNSARLVVQRALDLVTSNSSPSGAYRVMDKGSINADKSGQVVLTRGNASSGDIRLEGAQFMTSSCFSADEKWLAVGSSDPTKDPGSESTYTFEVLVYPLPPVPGASSISPTYRFAAKDKINQLRISKDGSTVASLLRNSTVMVFALPAGKVVERPVGDPKTSSIGVIAFGSDDGSMLYLGTTGGNSLTWRPFAGASQESLSKASEPQSALTLRCTPMSKDDESRMFCSDVANHYAALQVTFTNNSPNDTFVLDMLSLVAPTESVETSPDGKKRSVTIDQHPLFSREILTELQSVLGGIGSTARQNLIALTASQYEVLAPKFSNSKYVFIPRDTPTRLKYKLSFSRVKADEVRIGYSVVSASKTYPEVAQ